MLAKKLKHHQQLTNKNEEINNNIPYRFQLFLL